MVNPVPMPPAPWPMGYPYPQPFPGYPIPYPGFPPVPMVPQYSPTEPKPRSIHGMCEKCGDYAAHCIHAPLFSQQEKMIKAGGEVEIEVDQASGTQTEKYIGGVYEPDSLEKKLNIILKTPEEIDNERREILIIGILRGISDQEKRDAYIVVLQKKTTAEIEHISRVGVHLVEAEMQAQIEEHLHGNDDKIKAMEARLEEKINEKFDILLKAIQNGGTLSPSTDAIQNHGDGDSPNSGPSKADSSSGD